MKDTEKERAIAREVIRTADVEYITGIRRRLAAITDARDRLRAVLEPFVVAEWEFDSLRPEDWKRGWVLVEDIKRARAVHKETSMTAPAVGPNKGGVRDGPISPPAVP